MDVVFVVIFVISLLRTDIWTHSSVHHTNSSSYVRVAARHAHCPAIILDFQLGNQELQLHTFWDALRECVEAVGTEGDVTGRAGVMQSIVPPLQAVPWQCKHV